MTGRPTVGVLLAAGHSRRWGPDDKLLAQVRGRPLVSHAAAILTRAPVDRRAAVVRNPRVAALLEGMALLAPDGADQSASLRAAVAWARSLDAGRLLVLLGDMPAVTEATVAALVSRCGDRPAAVLYPDGRAGAPGCFPASRYAALAARAGDRGAGAGATDLLADAVHVRATPAELADVDRPQDLAAGD